MQECHSFVVLSNLLSHTQNTEVIRCLVAFYGHALMVMHNKLFLVHLLVETRKDSGHNQ